MIKVFVSPENEVVELVSPDSEVYWDSDTDSGVMEYPSFVRFAESNPEEARIFEPGSGDFGVFGFSYSRELQCYEVLCDPDLMKPIAQELMDEEHARDNSGIESGLFALVAEDNEPEYAIYQWALLCNDLEPDQRELILGSCLEELKFYFDMEKCSVRDFAEICGVSERTMVDWLEGNQPLTTEILDRVRDSLIPRCGFIMDLRGAPWSV